MNKYERQNTENKLRLEMEQYSVKLKDMILSQPPVDLLGYLWGQFFMRSMHMSTCENPVIEPMKLPEGKTANTNNQIVLMQLILEYVHAAWSSVEIGNIGPLDEAVCADIEKTAEELIMATFNYCLLSTTSTQEGIYCEKTSEIEFLAKSSWVFMRGNRYQVLEREFYEFVLSAHDDALKNAFGIGAVDISTGIQSITDAMREGHMRAANTISEQMQAAHVFAAERGLTLEQAAAEWKKRNPARVAKASSAAEDLFKGGICNLSKNTKLPLSLLKALAYERGENNEFFAPGALSGTPLRTLPVRIKPLIRLDGDYFATDPSFVRDVGYRAILWNLLDCTPDYRDDFNRRQKEMSESAFPRVFSDHLAGACIHNGLYYKDPTSGQWVENDTLILLDDVLILVEAKAGAAATIASPAVDFERHLRSIQDLVTTAYIQCHRFILYLTSATEVPLFKRESGRYVEFDRIRLADYRAVFPIGLTIESFAPYSAMCKEWPGIDPIIGKYPFVSMSIDDLFVLKRFLTTTGELIHYLEVRQAAAEIKGIRLVDEIDHLGAYIKNNRFDEIMRKQLSGGTSLVVWDGFSAVVDRHFEGDEWESRTPPKQAFPKELVCILAALDSTKSPGWLAVDSLIRNYAHETREKLAAMLRRTLPTLADRKNRWLQMGDDPSLIIWLQRAGTIPDLNQIRLKVCASVLATESRDNIVVLAFATPGGDYSRAERIKVDVP